MENKILKRLLTIYVLIILSLVIYSIIEPLVYNKNTIGKITNNENIYDVGHAILGKKYEVILYDKYDKIYDIFSYNCKSKLENAYDHGRIDNIINNFKSFQITDVQKKKSTVYVINYNEIFADNTVKEQKMIIKYKNNRAIIFYDSILEEDNG